MFRIEQNNCDFCLKVLFFYRELKCIIVFGLKCLCFFQLRRWWCLWCQLSYFLLWYFIMWCSKRTPVLQVNSGEAGSGFHVVLGNEACDVDSMVCALTYAYFLSKVRLWPVSACVCLRRWPLIGCLSVRLYRVRCSPSRCSTSVSPTWCCAQTTSSCCDRSVCLQTCCCSETSSTCEHCSGLDACGWRWLTITSCPGSNKYLAGVL